MAQQRWQLYTSLPDDVLAERLELFSRYSGSGRSAGSPAITPLIVQLLHNRSIVDPAEFESFLAVSEKLAHDSRLLPDVERAVERIMRALRDGEHIAVYGDFDADGITATVLMVQGLSLLGGRVTHYIPHRLDEGHGLNYPAMKELRESGVSLLVTVDCGINGFTEVEQARELGIDVIITDHHEVNDGIPEAAAAIDPKRPDSAYPFAELAGVGVAYKLLQALFDTAHSDAEREAFLDLVVLGTVADMVHLVGENRYLVKRGLEVLNGSRRVGVQEMVSCAGLEMGRLDSESIAYQLAPRLNSSGRMNHAVTSYELLSTASREEARGLALELEQNNSDRQRLTAEYFNRAVESLLPRIAELPLLMVGGTDYPPGVAGVVAGRLTDAFYRPAVVLQLDRETARGSSRSIPEFDIVSALAECQDLLLRFGGHKQAAGFQAPLENIGELNERLIKIAERELAGVTLSPVINIDAEVPLSALGGDTYQLISRLAPFGKGNQAPVFLSRKVQLAEARKMGSNGDHLSLKLRDSRIVWDAVAFGLGGRKLSARLDIVYSLGKDTWGGRQTLRLNIIDFLPSS